MWQESTPAESKPAEVPDADSLHLFVDDDSIAGYGARASSDVIVAAPGIESPNDIGFLHFEDLSVAGLMPVQRRKLWEVLQNYAKNDGSFDERARSQKGEANRIDAERQEPFIQDARAPGARSQSRASAPGLPGISTANGVRCSPG